MQNKLIDDELISVDDLAEIIKIDKQTIYRWCKRKMMPHIRIGVTYRFRKKEIIDWLNKNSVGEE